MLVEANGGNEVNDLRLSRESSQAISASHDEMREIDPEVLLLGTLCAITDGYNTKSCGCLSIKVNCVWYSRQLLQISRDDSRKTRGVK